jgi:hypothetical protein
LEQAEKFGGVKSIDSHRSPALHILIIRSPTTIYFIVSILIIDRKARDQHQIWQGEMIVTSKS